MVLLRALIALAAVPFALAGLKTVAPNRYIVEFDTTAHLQASGLGKRYASPHDYVYSQLEERGASFSINLSFDSSIFTGASVTVSSDADLVAIANATGVLSIVPVNILTVPDVLIDIASEWTESISFKGWPSHPGTGSGSSSPNATTSAKVTTTTTCTGSGKKQTCTTKTVTSPGSTQTSAAASYPTTGFSTLPLIGADKVHAAGNKGKGVKIGIIDGGVDYTRTPLGGCFGPGCKVAGGYDFVGDNYNGTNSPQPDSDPLDQCYTHGTSVAGVIGANDNELNVTGVAPEASIYMYRVYSCYGVTSDDIIVQAMIRAYTDGVDVVNLSVGESDGWTEGMLSTMASRLVSAGITVAVSAGNDGAIGSFYSYAPASGRGVVSTGFVNSTILPAWNASVSTGYGPIGFYSVRPYPTVTLPIYTYPEGSDPCKPPLVDLSSYLTIIREGDCPVYNISYNAFMMGSRALFLAQSVDGEPQYFNFPPLNVAEISKEDGDYLLGLLSAGTAANVSFSFNPAPRYNSYSGGLLAYGSEVGPTNDMYMSTQVSAPGTDIISVVPARYGNWTAVQGSSFSAPMAAGAAALYLAANPKSSPQKVREALEFSSTGVPLSMTDGSFKTLAATGAGVFNIYNALNAGVTVSPTELLLNDTSNFNGNQWIQVTNTGKSFATFKLSHVPAGTMIPFNSQYNQSYSQNNANPNIQQVANAATVKFSQSSVVLWPGASTWVLAQFTAPSGLDATTFPVYSGWIKITGGAQTVQVSYLGVAASLKNHAVLDGTSLYWGYNLPRTIGADGQTPQVGTVSYSYVGNDYPWVFWRFVGGTRYMTLDLVSANASLGFAPNYNWRRSDEGIDIDMSARSGSGSGSASEQLDERAGAEGMGPLELKARSDVDALSLTTKKRDLLGLGALWCTLTNNKGIGCTTTSTNTYSKVPIIGNLFELDYVPRNTFHVDNDYYPYSLYPPTFSNGSVIPNGTYKFLIRALKVGGDITNEADYDTWLAGEAFTIAIAGN